MKPKIEEIFLDVDDVLNRQTMASLKHVGCPVNQYDDSTYKPEWGRNIVLAANELHPRKPINRKLFTDKQFWVLHGRDFWANIPKSEEFDHLINLSIKLVGVKNVCLLTAPIDDPLCLAGKVDWINRNMLPELKRQFLIGPVKRFAASKHALLIDDSIENCEAFRKKGHAIVMPRPWNHCHMFKNSFDWIQTMIKDFKFPRRKK